MKHDWKHSAPLVGLLVAARMFASIEASAQEVHVYDSFPPFTTTDDTRGLRRGTNQQVLVVPVISQDTAFDPENNLLDDFDPLIPNLRADLVTKFTKMNELWTEASYGEVSFDADVLERFYQMPRELDHYFNPTYVDPSLEGTQFLGPDVDVPGGMVRLFLHVTDSDEQTIDLTFGAADSPYTFAELQTAIEDDLGIVGDKVELTVQNCGGDCRQLLFEVAQVYVRAGSYIHLDIPASDADVLDALGLDRPDIALGTEQLTAVGGEYPVTTTVGQLLTLELENDAGATESFDWAMGADTFADAAAFIAGHGATNPEVTVTSDGGELLFDATTTLAGAIVRMSFTGPAGLLDALGVDESIEVDGTIHASATNTIRGDRRVSAGQALAAFLMNELTRSPASPGPRRFPNTPITAANEAAIDALVTAQIDPRRIVAVIFLDGPNKRAGASGGWIPMGIDNGGYRYEHMSNASIQIEFDFTTENTITHETGHNIGFPDLYNNSSGEYDPMLRYPSVWDMMDSSSDFAHPGVWAKEVDNGWLSATGANIDNFPEPVALETRRYVLTPQDLSTTDYDDALTGVPADRTLVKAIRLPLGFGIAGDDHFLLVQNRQAGQQFSQTLPQHAAAANPGGVYITDAINRRSFDFFRPTTRNYVHPLSNVAGLGAVDPIIDSAPDPDVDFLQTYPAYDGLTVDIVDEIAGPGALSDRPSYFVNVTREQKGFLELGITPWGAPPWESPDIWIEHGDKEVLSDVPLAGNGELARWAAGYNPAANDGKPLNWIRVKVTNSGTVDATDVQIRVRVNTPGGLGDSGAWTSLPLSEPVDIPREDSRILQVAGTRRLLLTRVCRPRSGRRPWAIATHGTIVPRRTSTASFPRRTARGDRHLSASISRTGARSRWR